MSEKLQSLTNCCDIRGMKHFWTCWKIANFRVECNFSLGCVHTILALIIVLEQQTLKCFPMFQVFLFQLVLTLFISILLSFHSNVNLKTLKFLTTAAMRALISTITSVGLLILLAPSEGQRTLLYSFWNCSSNVSAIITVTNGTLQQASNKRNVKVTSLCMSQHLIKQRCI